jgi:hypothetical protein
VAKLKKGVAGDVMTIEIRLDADACKNISSIKSIMFAVYGPHSWF